MERLDSRDERGGGRIRLTLLGQVDLSDDSGRRIQSVLSQPKRVALLAYVAMAGRGRFVRRDELTAVFWPRRNDDRARKALRDALYFLRRALGDDVLLTPGDEVGLDWDRFECDAVELLEAVEAGDEERAREVYGGELLPGFHVSGARPFEEWVEGVRTRLAKFTAAAGLELAEAVQPLTEPDRGHGAQRRPAQPVWRSPLFVGGAVLAALWAVNVASSKPEDATHSELVLVTEFENLTGDSAFDVLGAYASTTLSQGLVDAGLTPATDPERVRQLLAPGDDEGGQGSRLQLTTDLARNLGATLAILGSVLRAEGGAELGAEVVDVSTGRIVESLGPFSWDPLAPEQSLLELRSRVMGSVVSRTTAEVAAFPTLERRPPRYEAFIEYVIGRRAHHRSGFADEFAAYERAIAIDPDFIQPQVMMMVSYANLAMVAGVVNGPPEAMRDPIRRGLQLAEALRPKRDGMAPGQRFWFDYQLADLSGHHRQRLTAARRLVAALPTEYNNFMLGLAGNKAMWFREAAEALTPIDPDRGEVRGWVYYWYNVAWALHQIENHSEELRLTREGYRRYPDSQQLLFGVFAALVALDRPAEAIDIFNGGWEISDWPAFGLRRPGGMFLLAARELRAHGYAAEAQGLFAQALQWHQSQADSLKQLERYRYEQAQTLYELDRHEEARAILVQLVEESDDRVNYRGLLGVTAAQLGDDQQVTRIDAWLETSAGDRPYGVALLWRARMAAVAGEGRRAVSLLQAAYREGAQLIPVVPLDHDLHTGKDWDAIRDDRAFQRLLEPRG